jgi:hypothetical protein
MFRSTSCQLVLVTAQRHRLQGYITSSGMNWDELIACFLLIRHGPHRKRKHRGVHKQQGYLISLILIFIQSKENKKWTLMKSSTPLWLDSRSSGQRPMAGSCEHGNEPSGSIKCWEFLSWLTSYQLLKRKSNRVTHFYTKVLRDAVWCGTEYQRSGGIALRMETPSKYR